MAHDHRISSELSRELSLFQITMMGLGMMIGAGVFLGIGNAIWIAGPGGVILTFVLNGVIAIMTACSYAELSSAIPRTGGAYNYARIGFGRGTSFLAGWMEWFASSIAGSLYAVTFSIYIIRYLDILGLISWTGLSVALLEKIMSVLVALLFIYINYRGASETGKVGAFFTFGQTLFLVVIGLIGIVVVIRDPSRLENFEPFMPNGWSKLLVTMGFTFVAFEGFEVIAQTGDEAIKPRQNLPKAMLYSVFIVTLTYAAVSFATVVSVKAGSAGIDQVPWQWVGQFRERGFGEAISRLLPLGNFLLTLAIIFASTSALNATVYSATRALYALGRDRMVPGFFASISSKRKTPWASLVFTGVLVISVVVFLPVIDVASSASMMFIMLFFLVNLCAIRVRQNMGDELVYGFLMPFFPYLPIIAIVCQSILAVWLIHMSLIAWIVAPSWIAGGLLIYHFYAKHHTVATESEIQVIEEEQPPVKEGFRAMVAVANPMNALKLIKTTRALCMAKQAQIELLHMVRVPDPVPLSDAEEHLLEGKEAITEAMLYLQPRFSIGTTIRFCRNVARGIVEAVREKRTNLLIMGWHGRPRTHVFPLGSTIDPIIERVPCNVVILKESDHGEYERILVPVAGGPNSRFALEVAGILASQAGGEITLLHVSDGKSDFDPQTLISENLPKLTLPSDRIHIRSEQSRSIVQCILDAAADHDLVVLGATRQPLFYKVTHESIPNVVARRCEKPLILAKSAARIESWIKRWI